MIVFEGVVRNNTKGRATLFLDYECYEAMAIKMMAEIGAGIASEFGLPASCAVVVGTEKQNGDHRIGKHHRAGDVAAGEISSI